ncbi:AAA family ATPase [Streptomyces mobaraensis NBRC 13819 = DSM 40847]|uniref:Gp71 n=1 Tax=Streptomyces mobaraensis (strain ATCC 29032 / DSM 40847 / JCM 4168 / NBRC 13819 / NCIMB 11159 / IPCR 16-22) TaxID=1223523 RepID=M3CFC3_STRM1|nr:AAA family ATPase [Streptomyces mobaraensis]EMF02421.1 gp71 [Streptomyces mobaraensis NBRC 13819 = DSM 40847]QTT76927.1 AAA family ATPase [Streptomyces mobaraensis NBRC 13819 = DSM 40847]
MYTLSQSIRAKGDSGDPLPPAFKSMDKAGTRYIRGQLSLTVAGGGTGKSAYKLSRILKAETPIPTIYFSADSSADIQLSRAISILTKIDMAESVAAVRRNDIRAYAPLLDGHPVRFDYGASPTIDDIETTVNAWYELYGEDAHMIVLDNITNIRGGGAGNDEDPFQGLESLMDWANDMARTTGAHVAGLHHTTGPHNDGNSPIPMSGVKGQITRVPALVLTLHKPDENTLAVSTVKNRAGRSDPSGNTFVELGFDGNTMQITDDNFSTVSY